MLSQEKTGLVIVDVQGRLAGLVHESAALLSNIRALIQGCQILKLPIIWLEQSPQALGPTAPELTALLTGYQPIEKHTFNGCDNSDFSTAVADSKMRQWLVCGIEAHICVYQTALGLLAKNYEVEVVADCVSSRAKANLDLALNKLQNKGVGLTSVEMCLYELLKDARKEQFKKILPLIK